MINSARHATLYLTVIYLSFPFLTDIGASFGITNLPFRLVWLLFLTTIGMVLFFFHMIINKNPCKAFGILLALPLLGLASEGAFTRVSSEDFAQLYVLDLSIIQIINGARNMYYISSLGVLLSVLAGSLLALGHFFRWVRVVADAVNQLLKSVPQLFALLLIFGLYNFWAASHSVNGGNDFVATIVAGLAIGLVLTPSLSSALISRMEQLKNQDFVQALNASGVSTFQITAYNLLWKNCRNEMLIQSSYQFGYAILLEVSLMFIYSLGFDNLGTLSYVSLGSIIATESGAILLEEGLLRVIMVSALILCSYVAANLLGDGFQTMTPRSQKV